MPTRNDDLRHGEAIAPAPTGLRRTGAASLPRPRGRRPVWRWTVAALVLGLVLWGVFFWLPRLVAGPLDAPPPALAAPPPLEPAALSPEQREALRLQGQALLARILTQQERIATLNPESWAAAEWSRYREKAREGDDAYLAERYDEAVAAYEDTLALGDGLLARSTSLVAEAMAAAERALAAADWELALSQFELVIGIDPAHEAALAGRERARRLPEVLSFLEQGRNHERARQWAEAVAAYRDALAIDAAWVPAKDALDRASVSLSNARFEALLSDGYAALAAEEYERAREVFTGALAMRPGAAAAKEGLAQAEQGAALDAIALAEVRAAAFERRELWGDAIAQYEAALKTDPTLAFAHEGLQRAQSRADLDIKLENLLENPDLLLRDGMLAEAERLLDQARGIREPGPRLSEQTAKLERLSRLAATPLTVTLRSDTLTDVTLYRVGVLGRFSETTLELRPGTYTAVGSRVGYRDVRATFTVLPGRETEPVVVRCSEPI